MKKNVVIAAATGYEAGTLIPFVKSLSLKTQASEVAIYLIIYEDEKEKFEKLREINADIQAIYVPRTSKLFRHFLNKVVFKYINTGNRFLSKRLHIALYRYFVALEYIKVNRDSINRVLLTDTRDVIFNEDPFKIVCNNGFVLTGIEDKLVSECETNSNWIKQIYGASELSHIGKNPIICSGVILGHVADIEKYLEKMTAELRQNILRCDMHGADQGVHNYIIRSGAINAEMTSVREGKIATVGYTVQDSVKYLGKGIVQVSDINSTIVHQYDRHKNVLKQVVDHYA